MGHFEMNMVLSLPKWNLNQRLDTWHPCVIFKGHLILVIATSWHLETPQTGDCYLVDTSYWRLPPRGSSRHLIMAIATSCHLETPHTGDCHLMQSRETSYWRSPPRAISRHLVLAIATSCNLETPRTGDCHLVQSLDTSSSQESIKDEENEREKMWPAMNVNMVENMGLAAKEVQQPRRFSRSRCPCDDVPRIGLYAQVGHPVRIKSLESLEQSDENLCG
ncbi:hypothetical protein AMTR_s00120p00059620 [Amborella trichopoda]|uniref:Uncharacterized protein n=1 Tax=Amborella trichopoda TaxID=13333 RepID=W1NT00_AMBTC|nr:hypothetical protein AMTR_s00120p00059620 [Amborella trichopoda]